MVPVSYLTFFRFSQIPIKIPYWIYYMYYTLSTENIFINIYEKIQRRHISYYICRFTSTLIKLRCSPFNSEWIIFYCDNARFICLWMLKLTTFINFLKTVAICMLHLPVNSTWLLKWYPHGNVCFINIMYSGKIMLSFIYKWVTPNSFNRV